MVTNPASAPSYLLDVHCHVGGLGVGSGCRVSPSYRKSFRFKAFMRGFAVSEELVRSEGDAIIFAKLSELLSASVEVDGAVVLALDSVVDEAGNEEADKTAVTVPGAFVGKETARYHNLHYGGSIHPHRRDALERLAEAAEQNVLLIKWLPPVQRIDPSERRHIPFYEKLAELGIPLLTHTGVEHALTGSIHRLGDPQLLKLPLEVGVTVIAAHAAVSGKSDGEPNFSRLLKLASSHPNLYADISSLTQLNRLGKLSRALAQVELEGRLLYGSDMPLINTPLVYPLAFAPRLGLAAVRRISNIANPWDRDVELKRALGVPSEVFTRGAGLLLGDWASPKSPGYPPIDVVRGEK